MATRLVHLVPAALAMGQLLACDSGRVLDPSGDLSRTPLAVPPSGPATTGFATLVTLPALSKGQPAEPLAVNNDGSVIVGYGWERRGTMRAVKWTRPGGSWVITALPHAATATGAIARAVNRAGDVAGNDWPGNAPHVVLWPSAGGFSLLGCNDLGEGNGISADGQVVVGGQGLTPPGLAAVWRPGSCREDLPSLVAGAYARAHAVNGDGTIVGGSGGTSPSSAAFPIRWTRVLGQWQAQQLDQRAGSVRGANVAGDLAGQVTVSCSDAEGCSRAAVWYSGGGFRQLGTLGGDASWARGINASGDVVGGSGNARGVNTGFFYFASTQQLLALPVKGDFAVANAVSDIRADGTRLVVGMDSQARPVAWTVRNP